MTADRINTLEREKAELWNRIAELQAEPAAMAAAMLRDQETIDGLKALLGECEPVVKAAMRTASERAHQRYTALLAKLRAATGKP